MLQNSVICICLSPNMHLSLKYKLLHCHFKGYTNWIWYTDKFFQKRLSIFTFTNNAWEYTFPQIPTGAVFGGSVLLCYSHKLKMAFLIFKNVLIFVFYVKKPQHEMKWNKNIIFMIARKQFLEMYYSKTFRTCFFKSLKISEGPFKIL